MHLLVRGDARNLAFLPDESVHCVVTSPPYFGLRDYGTALWSGGDPACQHQVREKHNANDTSTLGGGKATVHFSQAGFRGSCPRCGAVRVDRQVGLEESPRAYIESLLKVFSEVKRVMREDACLWVNIGDSYAGYHGNKNSDIPTSATNGWTNGTNENKRGDRRPQDIGLKQKDLVGIPWMLAFALRDELGFYLRMDVIWGKPNPMPESVEDRPTRSHEYLFLLAKSPRYFYDAEAIAEKAIREPHARKGKHDPAQTSGPMDRNGSSQYDQAEQERVFAADGKRNKRSVWTLATQGWPGAHFATMPPALVEPCVKAGTSERGVCRACGAPYERIVDKPQPPDEVRNGRDPKKMAYHTRAVKGGGGRVAAWYAENPATTLGWQPTCSCNAGEPVPAIVLDCFSGAATTGVVAMALGRRYIGVELSAEYLALSQRRIERPHAPVERPERDHDMPLFREISGSGNGEVKTVDGDVT